MKNIILKVSGLFLFVSFIAWAAELVVPEADPLTNLLALWTNWKVWGPFALASGILSFAVNAARKFLPSGDVKQIIVIAGGVLYSIAQAVVTGMGFGEAIITILLVSGGAILLYELFFKRVNKIVEAVKKGD